MNISLNLNWICHPVTLNLNDEAKKVGSLTEKEILIIIVITFAIFFLVAMLFFVFGMNKEEATISNLKNNPNITKEVVTTIIGAHTDKYLSFLIFLFIIITTIILYSIKKLAKSFEKDGKDGTVPNNTNG